MENRELLFTGGSGLLCSELKKLLPDANFPPHVIFDVTNYLSMCRYMNQHPDIKTLIHCAAKTSPPKVEENPLDALDVNIIGTAKVVKLCMKYGLRLIYISSDYVFSGTQKGGLYREDDPVLPSNKYSWSKMGGECSVSLLENSVIIRCSFGNSLEFPFDGAYLDQWTSREKASDIALKIIKIINSDFVGIIHIGSERRTVYEYAKSVSPNKDIKQISIKNRKDKVPVDVSLDTSLYDELLNK